MSWQAHPGRAPRGNTKRTLGDLLYTDRTKTRISEAEWVALVRAVAAGDQVALHALYERTHRIVFTLIMRIAHSREIAEEVTLDVFHDVWRRASKYKAVAGGSVIGWIMNQARSRAIDRIRFEQRKKRLAPPQADEPTQALEARDAGQVLDAMRQRCVLREALMVLTPDERQMIETSYLCELTYAEVAVRLNQPLGTVKTRIRSGLAKLRRALLTEKGSHE